MRTYQQQVETAAYDVFRSLGRGQEKLVYQRAFMDSIQQKGVMVDNEKVYPIFYENRKLIHYKPDFCINEKVIIQVMNEKKLKEEEELKFINHLTYLHLEIGYIINFGMKIQVRIKYRRDKVIPMN